MGKEGNPGRVSQFGVEKDRLTIPFILWGIPLDKSMPTVKFALKCQPKPTSV
jgi:hypothetical protein